MLNPGCRSRLFAASVCIPALLGGGVRAAQATQVGTRAVVEIVDAPRVTELAPMQFGRILKPTTGRHSVRLSPFGDRTLQGEGDGELLAGLASPAQLTIEASPGQTILVQVHLSDAGDSGLGLRDFEGSYNGSGATRMDRGAPAAFAATAEGILSLGAELTGLASSVSPPTHVLTLTLDVDYQ